MTPPAVMQAFVQQALRADPILADLKNDSEFNALQAGEDEHADARALRRSRSWRAARRRRQILRAAGAPDKQMVVLPGGDHAAQIEDTHDAWIAAVVNFLNRPAVKR